VSAPEDLIAGRYRLLELIGSGGMGAVWRARDERLHRTVALKELQWAPGLSPAETDLANQRAMREARITARLSHPYAVSIFDVVEHGGRPCIIMQFLPSVTLANLLRDGGPLDPDEAVKVGSQVAAALAAAHEAGITHRDVKPGNILIADDGTALISDFGISHALDDATLTSTGLIHGTPAFIAPEVARGGDATSASDVFSLGSTLYEALEGEPPFGRDPNTIALLHKVASGVFPPPQQAGRLTSLLQQMLAADPSVRPSMREVATRLERLATGNDEHPGPTPVPVPTATAAGQLPGATPLPGPTATVNVQQPGTTPLPEPTAVSRPRRQGRLLAGVAGLLIVVVLAGVGWWQFGRPDPLVAQNGGSASPAATPSADPTTDITTAAPSPTSHATTSSTSVERSPVPSTERSPTASPASPTRRPSSTSEADLAQAITSYYALMPTGTDQAWPRMTASYQANKARGRQAYQRFWDAIARVSVSGVTGLPPGRAQATITYFYKDGRVVTERTAYGLVEEDGQLKINSSTVLSSVTR
jgi:serine/threonine protein kinase